jgi:hypothetical protein
MNEVNTESRPIAGTRKVRADYKRPFAECEVKGCGKKFYGPRRNAKLGSHNFVLHLRGRKKTVKAAIRKVGKHLNRVIDLAPANTELGKVSEVLKLLKDLKPESLVIVKYFVEIS